MRWLVFVLAACGHDATTGDAARGSGDAATCVPPHLAEAAPASAASACTANNIPGSCLDVAACIDTRTPTPGLCAGSAAIECCTPRFADPIACDPNAAPLPTACLTEGPGAPGCPAGMARVAGICDDRFEALLVRVEGRA